MCKLAESISVVWAWLYNLLTLLILKKNYQGGEQTLNIYAVFFGASAGVLEVCWLPCVVFFIVFFFQLYVRKVLYQVSEAGKSS